MKFGFLLSLFMFGACQTYNSNTGDAAKYAPTTIAGSSEFQAAFGVVKNRCASCHTNYHAEWATLTTEQQWKDRGLVVAGFPSNSPLLTRLKNLGGDMPQDSGNIPADEYTALNTWVTNLE
jgi:hypothetical protein